MISCGHKVEMLAAVSPKHMGALYMGKASLDELDAAIKYTTGKTPNDKVDFLDKTKMHEVTLTLQQRVQCAWCKFDC